MLSNKYNELLDKYTKLDLVIKLIYLQKILKRK